MDNYFRFELPVPEHNEYCLTRCKEVTNIIMLLNQVTNETRSGYTEIPEGHLEEDIRVAAMIWDYLLIFIHNPHPIMAEDCIVNYGMKDGQIMVDLRIQIGGDDFDVVRLGQFLTKYYPERYAKELRPN